jgi:hypothetical protein
MQLVAVTQETLVSAELSTYVDVGRAAAASDQLSPFHTPPSGPGPLVTNSPSPGLPPTATHDVAETQLIPSSWFGDAVELGVLATDHAEPFHCSTSGTIPAVSAKEPTAMHMRGVVQSMPFSRPLLAPGGRGISWGDHGPPFQISANGLVLVSPTATQLVWVGHDTPFSSPANEPTPVGADWIDQRCPLKRSTNGPAPTAVHAPVAAHEIAHS